MIVHSSLKVILVLVYIVSLIKCIFIPNISLLSIMHLLLYHIHIYTNFTFNYLLPPPENPLPNTVSPKSYAWHRTALVHKHDGISNKHRQQNLPSAFNHPSLVQEVPSKIYWIFQVLHNSGMVSRYEKICQFYLQTSMSDISFVKV